MIHKEPLDRKTIHDLSIVFAQTKLVKAQQESPELDDEAEIRLLYTAYINAVSQMIVDNTQLEIKIESPTVK